MSCYISIQFLPYIDDRQTHAFAEIPVLSGHDGLRLSMNRMTDCHCVLTETAGISSSSHERLVNKLCRQYLALDINPSLTGCYTMQLPFWEKLCQGLTL
jgi:hypothetical protein